MSSSDTKTEDLSNELSSSSILTADDLIEIGHRYNFPSGLRLQLGGQSADRISPGYICVYRVFFEECELRFSVPSLLIDFCDRLGIQFAQICPNFVRQVMALLLVSKETEVHLFINDIGRLLVAK